MAPSNQSGIIAQLAAALAAHDLRRATALADTAMGSGIRDPLVFVARGLLLNEQGRSAEALALLERAETISVKSGAIREAIGLCLLSLDRAANAIAAFEAAAAMEPESAALRARMAWGYEITGELEAARRSYEETVRLQSRNALALGRLAYIAARLGSWDDARNFARRAMVVEPRQIAARLACAVADVEQGVETAERRLDDLLRDERVVATDRYIALGLLGNLRDRQDRVAEAFVEYGRANEVFARFSPARPGPTMYQTVQALKTHYEKAEPDPAPAIVADPSREGKPHIFLLGFPRSGTTLLEQVLASHPDVAVLAEKNALSDSVRAFLTRPEDFPRLAQADAETLAHYRDLYWKNVAREGVDASGKTFLDKTPINSVRLPLIARLFPGAKILFALRDPRDVVLSCYRTQFDVNELTREFVTLAGTARFYDAVMSLADIYRAKFRLDVRELRLEDLIDDFDAKAREACDFTGLAWNERLQDFAKVAKERGVATPSARQVVQGLNRSGVGQWRRYARELAPVLPVLAPWVKRFGYAEE